MSELDNFLGPRVYKEDTDDNETYTAPITNWPHAEERLRPLLEAWDAAFGFVQWSPFERKRILSSARVFAEMTTDSQILSDAIHYMQGRNLDIKDMRSCVTVGRRLLQKKRNKSYVFMPESAEESRRRARYRESLDNE